MRADVSITNAFDRCFSLGVFRHGGGIVGSSGVPMTVRNHRKRSRRRVFIRFFRGGGGGDNKYRLIDCAVRANDGGDVIRSGSSLFDYNNNDT